MTDPAQARILPWDRPRYTNAHFAEEERACWELKLRGWSVRRIATELRMSPTTVHRRLACAYQEFREGTSELRDQWIQLELERLEAARALVTGIMEANHLLVSEGHVVRLDGKALPDSGPVLAAVREYRALSVEIRKLLGLDAPTKHEHRHSTADVDSAVSELAELLGKVGAGEPVPEE